jgi:hypothetical protein
MKKIIFFYIILFLSILFFSCTTITRWPDESKEIKSKKISMEVNRNIFDDFLWTTPPIYSVKVDFKDENNIKTAKVKFGNKILTFLMNDDDEIALKKDDETVYKELKISKNDLYYNIDVLKTKYVPRSMLVTKTRFVTKIVPVIRTRPVTRTRFVTRFDSKGRSYSITEFYTDWESYTAFEQRTLPETYTEWETIRTKVVDIPQYRYYSFKLDEGQVVIYKIKNDDTGINEYYFQNTTYFSAITNEESDDGEIETKLLFIDTNSNGIYFEDEDAVLFNVWNPYEESSKFKEISNYMDNYWYRIKQIKTEKFLSFSATDDNKKLIIENANSKYITCDKKGKIEITGIPEDASVFFNGEEYLAFDGKIKRKIEYGIYNLKIENPGYIDYNATFIIDDTNPELTMEYKSPGRGGTLIFENDYLRNWKIIISSDKMEDTIYYNKKEINLPEGKYNVSIISGGFKLDKKITIDVGEKRIINYNDEVERLIRKSKERE